MFHAEQYLSIVERVNSCHRSKVIIHNGMWIAAEFDNEEQLDFFLRTLGINRKLEEEREAFWGGKYLAYSIDRKLASDSFWRLDELPAEAKPIKALSNGGIVTCYYYNDGETVTLYRPNPNAKEIYHPLTIEQHHKHRQIYGSY